MTQVIQGPRPVMQLWPQQQGPSSVSTRDADSVAVEYGWRPSLAVTKLTSETFRKAYNEYERESQELIALKEPYRASSEASSGIEPMQAGQMRKHTTRESVHLSTTILFNRVQQCVDDNNLVAGQELHCLITKHGLEAGNFLGSQVIRMYGILGLLSEAVYVLQNLHEPDVYSWSAIILAHVNALKYGHALDLYFKMQRTGIQPDGHIFVAVLKACIGMGNLEEGKHTHSKIIMGGLESEVYIGSTLIDMYGKWGNLEQAQLVFDKLPCRNVVVWSVLIAGYVHYGRGEEALELINQMQEEEIKANVVTFVWALKACSSVGAIEAGRRIHSHIIECGVELNAVIGSAIVDMYINCASLSDACMMFCALHERDVMAWNTLIAGFAIYEHVQFVFKLLGQMQQEKVCPNVFTYVPILKACSKLDSLEQICSSMIETGCELDACVGSSLIHMYRKCGSIKAAYVVFNKLGTQNVVTWSALILGLAEHGYGHQALKCFEQMKREGTEPNPITYVSILQACASIKALEKGKQIHADLIDTGMDSETHIGNALIDMYVKCDCVGHAFKAFDKLLLRDVISWSALIAGYSQQHKFHGAFQLFEKMQEEGVEPNAVTFITLLKICSSAAALEHGQEIHGHITSGGFDLDPFIGSALIEMYAKCGLLEAACMVFERLPKHDLVVWTAMITGYSQNGNYKMAHKYFKQMQLAGLKPDDISFLSVLSASNHGQFLEEGCTHFKSMTETYKLYPRLQHYNCMVDLLGSSGHLEEAQDLLESIPFGPNNIGWMSLLTSCRKCINVALGAQCFDLIIAKDKKNAAAYVLMSSIYASANMVDEGKRVDDLRTRANDWKKPGHASIEVENQVHSFVVGDVRHQQSNEIYAKLNLLKEEMLVGDLGPGVGFFVPGKSKEEILCSNLEKLALSFGLISTP